ncbi:MAG: peptidase [Magnetococcales bacterium]|nr:peptidase [Magnetococcales bacterium]
MNMKSKFQALAAGNTEPSGRTIYPRIRLGIGLILLLSAPAGHAEDQHHPDHELARRMVQSGTILPLQRIVEGDPQIRGKRLLDVELEKKQDDYFYEIKILDEHGTVRELWFNARTGTPLSRKPQE